MRFVEAPLKVSAGRGAVDASGVDQSNGQVGVTEQRLRHDDFDAARQREVRMPSVVDLLEGVFQPRERRLASARVVPDVAAIAAVQAHPCEDIDNKLAYSGRLRREFLRVVAADALPVRPLFTTDLQAGEIADRALDLLGDALRAILGIVIGNRIASLDVLREVRDVGADFFIAVRFDQQAVPVTGAEVGVADGDAAAAGFKDRQSRAAVRTGHFQSGDLANRRGLADALAADERDVVFALSE